MNQSKSRYLVLDLTNGDGYSDPTIKVHKNRLKGIKRYYEYVGQNITQGLAFKGIENRGSDMFCAFATEDEDGNEIDNFACHFILVNEGDIIVINTDFTDELSHYTTYLSIPDVIYDLNIKPECGADISITNEKNYLVSKVADSETGTIYILIKVI
jgi:hypothetical protein